MPESPSTPDVHAVADAILLLSGLRLRYAAEIPAGIWRMMMSAERRLNADLEAYFRPYSDDSSSRSADHPVGLPTSESHHRSSHTA